MDKEEYKKLVNRVCECPNTKKNFFISFISGGILGAAYHIMALLYKNFLNISIDISLCLTLITFVTSAIILTGLGVFDNFVKKYRFGLIIPITGFAHSVMSCILDNKKDGLISGIGANAFKLAGSVILYGTVSAFILALVKVWIYG